MISKRMEIVGVTIALIVVLSAGLAYSQLWVTSNVEHVSVNYTIRLSSIALQDKVMLTAHLENASLPMNGKGVAFYMTKSYMVSVQTLGGSAAGYWTFFASALTDASGNARANYTITDCGEYYFLAQTTVP